MLCSFDVDSLVLKICLVFVDIHKLAFVMRLSMRFKLMHASDQSLSFNANL